jgi:hypothetical protein
LDGQITLHKRGEFVEDCNLWKIENIWLIGPAALTIRTSTRRSHPAHLNICRRAATRRKHYWKTDMELHAYGLLIGRITASRPKRPGSPHWLLMVQPRDPEHPAYRVAVNLQTTEPRRASEPEVLARGKKTPVLQYQILDFGRRGGTPAGNALIKKLISLGMTRSFLSADSEPSIPRLDFVRGGFIDPRKFVDLPAGSKTLLNEFKRTLTEARNSGGKSGAMVAVFGTGYPTDPETGVSVPTGFTVSKTST